MQMTPAELKTLREALGLTCQWLADEAGVSMRTVQYWEAGRTAVPSDVAQILVMLDERVSAASKRLATDAEASARSPRERVTLTRYRCVEEMLAAGLALSEIPFGAQSAVIYRAKKLLEVAGLSVKIEFLIT